ISDKAALVENVFPLRRVAAHASPLTGGTVAAPYFRGSIQPFADVKLTLFEADCENRLFAAECGHGVSPLTRPRARCTLGLAEGVGFEPTERSLNGQRFSRPTGVLPLTCLLATVMDGLGHCSGTGGRACSTNTSATASAT